MPPSEYENLLSAITTGFAGVHARIDAFKDEFNGHKTICAKLFADIDKDTAVRKAGELEKEQERKRGIDWGRVKTATTIAVSSLLTLAALKILFTNIGKFTW